MPELIEGEFRGMPALHLQSGDGARATVVLHGAHLVSWQPAGQAEQLYLSPTAVFDAHAAIRGGVPVIFPQFDRQGVLPRHGFARTARWLPQKLEQGDHHALAVLRLIDDEASLAIWAHRFVAELSVQIGASRLDVELAVECREPDAAIESVATAARSVEPLRFTAALHTYLRVSDAAAARVDGLQRLRYFDKVRSTEQVDSAPRLMADGELDRIYFDVAKPLQLHDGSRRVEIFNHGFPDVVVWNPGAERAALLDDLPNDGWRDMFCIEAAAIGKPVVVRAGECWIGRQTIVAEDTGDARLRDRD